MNCAIVQGRIHSDIQMRTDSTGRLRATFSIMVLDHRYKRQPYLVRVSTVEKVAKDVAVEGYQGREVVCVGYVRLSKIYEGVWENLFMAERIFFSGDETHSHSKAKLPTDAEDARTAREILRIDRKKERG